MKTEKQKIASCIEQLATDDTENTAAFANRVSWLAYTKYGINCADATSTGLALVDALEEYLGEPTG